MASKPFVIVGMSGGVDSSVAAQLLLEQGYRVEGLFMKNWEETDDVAYCTAQQDMEDAEDVCAALEIPLHRVNFSKQYWDNVFEYFLAEYRAGRTPNPDVMCNKEIKFSAFLNYALRLGADKIATGHYCRVNHHHAAANSKIKSQLLKGKDNNKDQSYFLHLLGQHELAHSLFPLGELEKTQVRDIATASGFVNHEKKDSTGICFIGERRFRDFLARFLPNQTGPIKDLDGNILGEHTGSMYYTTGQRQGLGIGGVASAPEAPWFVAKTDVKTNTVYVVQGHDHPALHYSQLICEQLHWINPSSDALPNNTELHAKIRYRQADQHCTLLKRADNTYLVTFQQSQRAITRGQSIVFYHHDICLGGAIIKETVTTHA